MDIILDEPNRPSLSDKDAGLLWYPLAEAISPRMTTRGKYSSGYPRGAIVHFTAGRDETEDQARGTVTWGREQGYCYFVIGPTGHVYQAFPLDEWGYHAGESNWSGLGPSVSSKLVGIEVCCAGLLDNNRKSWFGKTYPADATRKVTEAAYGCPTGIYRKYTEDQEESLIQLLTWLAQNKSSVFRTDYILGHHEVSGKQGIGYWRKNDPGGALSMTMPRLRELIQARTGGN